MENEIKDALDRADKYLAGMKHRFEGAHEAYTDVYNCLLALNDAVAAIADKLPEPNRVPLEQDDK